ncbi:MAG: LysR family transcriptional regulator [Blautia massiliensis (ex Durand et al. 2017)]
MTYQDIHTFLTIASSSSLSKAAESLFVSQPALSHRLSALEEELGTELIIGCRKAIPHTGATRMRASVLSQLPENGNSCGLKPERLSSSGHPHSFEL